MNRACELHWKSSKAKAEYIVSSSSSWWVVSHSLSVYSRLSRSDHSSSTSASRIYHFGRVAWVLCGDFPHDFLSCQWIHFSLLFHSFDAPCRCQYYFHENNAVYHSRLRLLTMWQGLEVCLNNSDLTSNIHWFCQIWQRSSHSLVAMNKAAQSSKQQGTIFHPFIALSAEEPQLIKL